MNNFIIRKIKPADILGILEIQSETNLCPWSQSAYIDELQLKNSISKVAEKENRIIGFIVVRLITPNVGYGEAEIMNIAVQKDLQGKGIGKRLLESVFEELKAKEIREVWLEVRESNISAQKFYLSNSFKIRGRRKNFYNIPVESAILMQAEII